MLTHYFNGLAKLLKKFYRYKLPFSTYGILTMVGRKESYIVVKI